MNQSMNAIYRRQAARAVCPGFLVFAATIAVLASRTGPARAQEAKAEQDSWYVVRMAGRDVGHMHETTRGAGGGFTTIVETLIVINRLANKVEIRGKSVFDETTDGRLRGAHSEMTSSRQTTTLDASVTEKTIRLIVSTGGKEYRRELAHSGAPSGPWGIRQRTLRGLAKPGDTVTCQTLVPEMERLAQVTRKLVEKASALPAPAVKSPCDRVEERLEGYPSLRSVWLDDRGRMVRQTEPGPFGESEVILTDRATALRAAGGSLPEEMYDRTLVRANVRLPGPRSLDRVVVRVSQEDPSRGWPDFAGPGQSIVRREGDELLLEVRRIRPDGAAHRPSKPDGALREFLEPNAVVQSDDAEVRRVAREVAGDEADPFRAACRLRDWVRRNLTLDLGIAVAPASEVIRQRKGTCVAYAVALASLARAEGIPSRVVMGYAYVSGVWGGHAWVEVLAGGRWVPLDGALTSPGPADAARFACVRTSLADGPGPLLDALGRITGNIRVTVIEYQREGVRTEVTAGARGFTIEGDTYRNPWLGLEVRTPAGFRFTKTDAVYPDTRVVALEGPTGRRVGVRQYDADETDGEEPGARALRRLGLSGKPTREESGGRTVLAVDGGGKAGLAFVQGPDLWVVTAEGPEAGALLRRAAELVTIRPAGG